MAAGNHIFKSTPIWNVVLARAVPVEFPGPSPHRHRVFAPQRFSELLRRAYHAFEKEKIDEPLLRLPLGRGALVWH